jgi:hypothetical protein
MGLGGIIVIILRHSTRPSLPEPYGYPPAASGSGRWVIFRPMGQSVSRLQAPARSAYLPILPPSAVSAAAGGAAGLGATAESAPGEMRHPWESVSRLRVGWSPIRHPESSSAGVAAGEGLKSPAPTALVHLLFISLLPVICHHTSMARVTTCAGAGNSPRRASPASRSAHTRLCPSQAVKWATNLCPAENQHFAWPRFCGPIRVPVGKRWATLVRAARGGRRAARGITAPRT